MQIRNEGKERMKILGGSENNAEWKEGEVKKESICREEGEEGRHRGRKRGRKNQGGRGKDWESRDRKGDMGGRGRRDLVWRGRGRGHGGSENRGGGGGGILGHTLTPLGFVTHQ